MPSKVGNCSNVLPDSSQHSFFFSIQSTSFVFDNIEKIEFYNFEEDWVQNED